MLSELRVWSLVAVTAAIWLTLAAASVVSGNTDALSVIVDLLPLLLVVALAFERRGWRAQWLHPRWVSTPVVGGTGDQLDRDRRPVGIAGRGPHRARRAGADPARDGEPRHLRH